MPARLLATTLVATALLVTATPATATPVAAAPITPAPTAAQRPAATPPDTYLDETARHLVLGARAARDTARIAIDSYTALVRERLGVSLSVSRRDRRLANGESVARIRWSRSEPEIVHVLGSRFRLTGFHIDDGFGQVAVRHAANPLQDPFVFGFAVLGADSVAAAVRSPLDADAGSFYQFQSGDTIVVQLPSGRSVRVVSVTAIPRFRSVQLVAAVMWIETETFGLARVAYRPAKRLESEFGLQLRRAEGPNLGLAVELDDGSMAWDSTTMPTPGRLGRLLNGAVNNLLPQTEMDVTAVVADYTLREGDTSRERRYWLPRRVKWAGYLGTVDDVGTEDVPRVVEPVSYEWIFDIEDVREPGAAESPGTPATAAEALALWREPGDSIRGDLESTDPAEAITILPGDRGRLATNDLLPPPIWDESIGGLDDRSMEEFGSILGGIGTAEDDGPALADPGQCPCHFEPPIWTWRLLRYNAREGLSAGTRVWQDLGWGKAIATARFRTAYRYPDFSFAVQHEHPRRRLRASVYGNVFPFHNVQRALWATGDSVTIHRTGYNATTGVALQLLPGRNERNWASVRLFAERVRTLGENDSGTRTGASVRLAPWWGGLAARSVGGGGEVAVRGSLGANPIVKASATGALSIPLGAGWSSGLEAGGGRIWGNPTDYDLWLLGGGGDRLRGYSDDVLSGRSFWRARAELQRSLRLFRVALFGDWASTGGPGLYSAGVGISLFDGLVRMDLARGLSEVDGGGGPGVGKAGWQVHWRADSVF
ncbi:MAG: hypothetical protein OXU74_00335 [Gemmatimonadota bacterium]|nr:hypothetical protein [Gemmatimonadota bacterium]